MTAGESSTEINAKNPFWVGQYSTPIVGQFSMPIYTRLYIEALLVDEEAADAVWEIWDCGQVSDDLAAITWWLICLNATQE